MNGTEDHVQLEKTSCQTLGVTVWGACFQQDLLETLTEMPVSNKMKGTAVAQVFWQLNSVQIGSKNWPLMCINYSPVKDNFSKAKVAALVGIKSHLHISNSIYMPLEEDWLSPLEVSGCFAEQHSSVFLPPPALAELGVLTPGPLCFTARPRRVVVLLQASKTGSDISSSCRFTVSLWLVPLHCPHFPVWAWRKWPERWGKG